MRVQEQATRTPEERGSEAIASNLLQDTENTSGDLALVARSKRWGGLTPEKQEVVTERLMGIVEKTHVSVVDKDGGVHEVDGPADENAIKAANIIKGLVSQQQKDEHFRERQANPKQASQTQINVGVNIGADERREKLSAIASRIGIDFVPEVSTTEAADVDTETVVRIADQSAAKDS